MKYKVGQKVSIKSAAEMRMIDKKEKVFGGLTAEMIHEANKTAIIQGIDQDAISYGKVSYYLEDFGFTWDERLLDPVYEPYKLEEDLFEL